MTALIGSGLAISAFVGFWVFVLLYAARSFWWKTPVGRNLMAFMFVCGVLLGTGFARSLMGDVRWDQIRDEVRMVSLAAINVVVWWRNVLLVKTQRQLRREAAQMMAEASRLQADIAGPDTNGDTP